MNLTRRAFNFAKFVFALLATVPVLLAQVQPPSNADEMEPTVTAMFVPETVPLSRPVIYRVTVAAMNKPQEPPTFSPPADLDVSFAGSSVSLLLINGKPATSAVYTYSVTPQRTGRHTIPAFEINTSRGRLRVPAATLVVTQADAGAAPYQPVRAELELPKRDLFVGETVNGRLLLIETPDESPQFISHVAKTTGAAVIRPSLRTSREQFTFGGQQYEGLSMPLRVTPILEGDLELSVQAVVRVQKFELPGQRGFGGGQSTVDSRPARIRVLALPRAGRPQGFTGAIGKFTVAQPKLSASEIEAGEPVTLTVAMAGEGNLEGVAAPELGSSGDWQIYKPTSEFQPDADDRNSTRGAKVFTYTLVPGRAGLKSTPAMPFCYFDPERRAYVDITVPPLPVTVKPSANAPAPADPEPAKVETPRPGEPPRVVEPAMAGLADKPGKWTNSPAPPLREWWLLAAECSPPLLLLVLWAWRCRRDWLAANPQMIRRRRAHAAARRALARARAAARKGDRSEFLRAGAGALREAASPLDTARAESLTREEVLRLLNDDAKSSAIARQLLDSADAANYATANASVIEPHTLLPELERAVRTLARRA